MDSVWSFAASATPPALEESFEIRMIDQRAIAKPPRRAEDSPGSPHSTPDAMTGTVRTPSACPHRGVGTPQDSTAVTCGLVGALSQATDRRLWQVREGFCEACCGHEVPEKDRLNPFVASLLYDLTRTAIEQHGVDGCSEQRARALQETAVQNLARVSRDFEKATAPPYVGPCIFLGSKKRIVPVSTAPDEPRQKRFYCRHSEHADTSIDECRSCLDYEPELRPGSVSRWAVGITTAPRESETVARMAESLGAAGWDLDTVHLFAEPDAQVPGSFADAMVSRRNATLGAWPNFLLGLMELTLRDPHADAYLMCQDDAIFCKGLRDYLEDSLWPATRLGVVSLHTASHLASDELSGFYPSREGWGAWGAMGYIFPNASARAFLRHPMVGNHRNRGRSEGLCNIDSIVGEWCLRSGLDFYLHAPSLCQHIGETSTLWKNNSLKGRRSASDFPGENSDIRDVMRKSRELGGESRPEASSPPGHRPSEFLANLTSDEKPTLAIVTVHIGREDAFPRWRDWILHAEFPPSTSLYVVDNSANAAFGKRLRDALDAFERCGRFRTVCHLKAGGPVSGGSRLSFKRCQNCADALNMVLPHTSEDLVLTVDDDTIPPLDAATVLIREILAARTDGEAAGIVSGSCESANFRGHLAAARAKHAWTNVPRVGEVAANELIEVGFVGNACCLMSKDAVKTVLPMRAEQLQNGAILGPDGVMCRTLRNAGYSVWLHGGVVCEHLI